LFAITLVQTPFHSFKAAEKELLTNKSSFFVYPSRRLGISLTHEVQRILSAPTELDLITRQRAFSCGLMIYTLLALMLVLAIDAEKCSRED